MSKVNKLIQLVFSVLIMVGCFQTKLNMGNGDDSKDSYFEGKFSDFQNFIDLLDDDSVDIDTIDELLNNIDNLKAFYEYGDDMCQLIHIAAANGEGDIINSLISRGVSVDCKSENGKTVLHYAAAEGWEDLAKDLIDKDEKLLTVQDADGNTPLHCAIYSKYAYLAEFLIDKSSGEDLCVQDNHGYTALHYAAALGFENLVDKLIKKEPEIINIQNNNRETAMHVAVLREHVGVIKKLMLYNPDLNKIDKEGLTVIILAKRECTLGDVRKQILNILSGDNNE